MDVGARRFSMRRRPARCRSCSRSAREWLLGSPYGPPLAYWLADIAFRAAGGVLGVYLLSQLCVVVTYLGGVRARPPHPRRRACRDGDPADGGHQRVHGADAGIRAERARDAAHRADPAVRLPRARRQPARRLDRRRRRARPAAAHDLCGAHPARADGAVRRRDRAAGAPARLDRTVGRGRDRGADLLPASVLAGPLRATARCPHAGPPAQPARRRKAADGMGQSRPAAAVQPCRAGRAGDGRGRPARRKAHQRARGRARAGRAVREALRLLLRARAGVRGDAARGACWSAPRLSAAPGRSSCSPASPSWSRRAT